MYTKLKSQVSGIKKKEEPRNPLAFSENIP